MQDKGIEMASMRRDLVRRRFSICFRSSVFARLLCQRRAKTRKVMCDLVVTPQVCTLVFIVESVGPKLQFRSEGVLQYEYGYGLPLSLEIFREDASQW
jgi:hypothetical protein